MVDKRLASVFGLATVSALALTGCFSSSSDDDDTVETAEREHDERSFSVEESLSFEGDTEGANEAVQSAMRYWGTYDGIQGEAGYTVEIPEGWDGDGLIMWTRGFGGEGEELPGVVPRVAFRNAVIEAGYAWAASTYSANFYDVRAAIEDTNTLAINVVDFIEADGGPSYDEPAQFLIAGNSLGGHTAAAAVERETLERAATPVAYEGALPLCQAEQNQFQWLGDYTRVAHLLAGFDDAEHQDFPEDLPMVLAALFELDGDNNPIFSEPTDQGERLKQVARELTGGDRPIFEEGFAQSTWQFAVLGTGGGDGTVTGILARNIYDNTDRTYADEVVDMEITRVAADDGVNPLRDDGVRWLPLIKGEFDVPVLTMHTLGDFFVPFEHQKLYRQRAEDNGNGDMLVQRAIRAPGHCDFADPEIETAVADFLGWVNDDDEPAGDPMDEASIADDDYGCEFTAIERPGLPQCSEG